MFDAIRSLLLELGVPADIITSTARLSDDLEMDSTEMVELNVLVKRQFGCRLPHKFHKGNTVADLVAFVEGQARVA